MANDLSTIGSIATHLAETFPNIPAGVSGNLLILADLSRQHVENYTGDNIGSNSIADTYQPAILDFTKADLVDLLNSQQGGEQISLAELSINETGGLMSADQYRKMGEFKLRTIGKDFKFVRSLS